MTEKNELNPNELDTALFLNLIQSLAESAMFHLGKLVNRATGKAQVNLEAAAATIDMLAMLENKTKGNLSPEETRFLRNILSTLQLNFVETEKSGGAPAAEPTAAETTGPTAGTGAPAPEIEHGAKTDEKQPKFHKSY